VQLEFAEAGGEVFTHTPAGDDPVTARPGLLVHAGDGLVGLGERSSPSRRIHPG
jgi:hypothetical protein